MRHSHIWLQRRGRLKRWCGFVVRQISSRIVIIKSSLTNLVFQYSECSKTCACSVRRAAGRVATTVAATPVAAAVAAAVATSNRAPCQKKLWLCLRKNMCAVWLNVCPEGFYVCPEPSCTHRGLLIDTSFGEPITALILASKPSHKHQIRAIPIPNSIEARPC